MSNKNINKNHPVELNLLNTFPKIKRNINLRKKNKDLNRQIALKFEKEYFDGPREQGYGGYYYDGRWVKVANKLVDLFNLKTKSKILDVGCAKGFLLHDLNKIDPSFELHGVEISKYAIKNSQPSVNEFINNYSCEKLLYPDDYFDCVVAINTVHNLKKDQCINSIKEIQRVSGGRAFIQVDAYRNNDELDTFKDWMLTAQTYMKPIEWIEVFKESGYKGYYFWTILETE